MDGLTTTTIFLVGMLIYPLECAAYWRLFTQSKRAEAEPDFCKERQAARLPASDDRVPIASIAQYKRFAPRRRPGHEGSGGLRR